jgi:hypothetical protein
VELLGRDGAVSSAAEEPEIIVPNLPPIMPLVPETSLFEDEIKKKPKKEKKSK